METINVNGTEYVKAEDAKSVNLQNPSEWEHVCVIADRGWIFEGYRSEEDPNTLRDAHVVRKWSNGLGIGGLADPMHKADYTLDELGSVSVSASAVIAVVPLEW